MQVATPPPDSFLVFNRLPLEIGIIILEKCSPYDLSQLSLTSKRIRALISRHPRIWQNAYDNISRGDCPPPPACPQVEASGFYGKDAYAIWLFGGGPCTYCTKSTTGLPCDFIFRNRACSPKCYGILRSRSTNIIDTPKKYTNHVFTKWLAQRMLPSKSTPGDLDLAFSRVLFKKAGRELEQAVNPKSQFTGEFRRRTWTELKEEYSKRETSRPILHQNATDLTAWAELYQKEKVKVEKANREFMSSVSRAESIRLQQVLRCSTMKRLVSVFGRDLSLITFTVWMEYRRVILAELEVLLASQKGKAPCPYCDRFVKVLGIRDHMILSHQHEDPNATPYIRELGRDNEKRSCMECPFSKRPRLFTPDALELHRLHCHDDTVLRTTCRLCPPGSDRQFTTTALEKHVKAKHYE
ncbi:hypothetical protein MIND_00423800 [Mycena indigotica]|uniref:F-box domain-containing protein n=1 Tax=Mycena indigotica TaxID=2126181 RepID=A0A8H6SX70_9AGAR|nr:uncharacterized protein MIND_00423800 [Mycena indigotica]KAF7306326.1 hypothetical protein MIND_00423800 [Mycena indigotica]